MPQGRFVDGWWYPMSDLVVGPDGQLRVRIRKANNQQSVPDGPKPEPDEPAPADPKPEPHNPPLQPTTYSTKVITAEHADSHIKTKPRNED